jgi:transitional endoplasmic reticulum ATPase
MEQDSIQLTVQEVDPRDIGRGIARIDHDSMDSLNVSAGNAIEIKGKKTTVVKCLPPHSSDEGNGIIRLDELACINLGVAPGDTITARKIKAIDAEIIAVYPLEATHSIDEHYLTEALENNFLIRGNKVMIPYFGASLTFEVIWIRPVDAVSVTHNTIFHIAKESEVELQKDGNGDYEKEMRIPGLNVDLNKLV